MYTAKIISITADQTPGVAQVTFVYSNGVDEDKKITERVSDPNTYKSIAANAINELNRLENVKSFIENPPIGVIDFSVPQPTDEQIALQNYNSKKQQLITAKQDLDLELLSQQDYDNLLAEVKKLTPA